MAHLLRYTVGELQHESISRAFRRLCRPVVVVDCQRDGRDESHTQRTGTARNRVQVEVEYRLRGEAAGRLRVLRLALPSRLFLMELVYCVLRIRVSRMPRGRFTLFTAYRVVAVE